MGSPPPDFLWGYLWIPPHHLHSFPSCSLLSSPIFNLLQPQSSSTGLYFSLGLSPSPRGTFRLLGTCCGNHQSQRPIATQAINLSVGYQVGITRKFNKKSLLYQSPIYTNYTWSVLLIIISALISMLYSYVYLISYSRPPYDIHVP